MSLDNAALHNIYNLNQKSRVDTKEESQKDALEPTTPAARPVVARVDDGGGVFFYVLVLVFAIIMIAGIMVFVRTSDGRTLWQVLVVDPSPDADVFKVVEEILDDEAGDESEDSALPVIVALGVGFLALAAAYELAKVVMPGTTERLTGPARAFGTGAWWHFGKFPTFIDIHVPAEMSVAKKKVDAVRRMRRVQVPGDGNCFYSSIAEVLKKKNQRVVREELLKYLKRIRGGGGGAFGQQLRELGKEELDRLENIISKNGAWADDAVVHLAAHKYGRRINVFNALGRPVFGGAGLHGPSKATKEISLLWVHGNHYEPLVPAK